MPASKPRTLADFRASHDKSTVIPNKIRAALAVMAKQGPEHYEYEAEFLKLASLSVTDLAAYRDQFAPHLFIAKHLNGKSYSTPKNIWFATKQAAAKARGA